MQLKSIQKQGISAAEYVLKIKKVIGSLATVKSPISTEDHIEAILGGLSEEYSSFITTVISRSNPFTVDELEALLMAQEEILKRFKKKDLGPIQANVTQAPSGDSKPGNGEGRGRSNGGRRGRGRSRGGRSWNNG